MGTRVMLQFTFNRFQPEISPIIYCHWCEEGAPRVLCRLRDQMESVCGRGDELAQISARCVQQLTRDDDGATGVRIRNSINEMTIGDLVHGADMFVVEIGERWRVRQIHGNELDAQYPEHPMIDWVYEGPTLDESPSL